MSGSAFAVTHHAFSSGAGRTSDGNGSHASTLKSPSYTKSVSWQHYHQEQINIGTYISKYISLDKKLIEHSTDNIELLKERRTALISAAVTGKIDLRNWTAPIPEAETPTEASA